VIRGVSLFVVGILWWRFMFMLLGSPFEKPPCEDGKVRSAAARIPSSSEISKDSIKKLVSRRRNFG
jgi:hypothetical protein